MVSFIVSRPYERLILRNFMGWITRRHFLAFAGLFSARELSDVAPAQRDAPGRSAMSVPQSLARGKHNHVTVTRALVELLKSPRDRWLRWRRPYLSWKGPPIRMAADSDRSGPMRQERSDPQMKENIHPPGGTPRRKLSKQDVWAYLERNLRQGLGEELDQLRKEQGLSQAVLAGRTDATQPMLSRLFKADDERSPTLETLVKIAWGLNRHLEINLVSDLPSKDMLIPKGADPSLWPGSIPLRVEGLEDVLLVGIRLRKFEVETNSDADDRTMPAFHCRYTTEGMIEERANLGSFIVIKMPVVSRVVDSRNTSTSLLLVRATLEACYRVGTSVPKQQFDTLMGTIERKTPEHLWARYREILKSAATKADMPLRIIAGLQEFHADPARLKNQSRK